MSDAQSWIVNGYPGSVSVAESYDGDPGIPSPALNLDEVVGQSVVLPVFANPRLEGANATYRRGGFRESSHRRGESDRCGEQSQRESGLRAGDREGGTR